MTIAQPRPAAPSPDGDARGPVLATLPRPPGKGEIARWVTTWRAVYFHARGSWHIGVVRAWIRLHDGRWIAQIEHAQGGLHPEWPHVTWAVFDRRLLMPVPVPAHGLASW